MTMRSVVVCTWSGARGEILEETEAALTIARKTSVALGSDLRWLAVGSVPDEAPEIAQRHGVAALEHIEDPKLAGGQADAFVEALAQYCRAHSPKLVVFSQGFDIRLVAPRLAGRLGSGVVMNAVDIDAAPDGPLSVTASAYGGDTRVIYEMADVGTCIVSLLANAVVPERVEGAAQPAPEPFAVDLSAIEERVRVIEAARTEGPRLEDAEIIVAGGRGLASPENYKLVEQLAEAMGGLPGASRPLVDEGWVDSSRQVGLTGKITRPALYVAAGISGASQHMAGCAAAKSIAAINTDPDAAIFRYARYGVVGDCLQILPELIRAAKQGS
ncbi:MAG: electron transfer flavoprotein subunit alpha/FixB family protein [Myxococcota bacterium]|nr:electron transfer flavoprotein subunit alpha [Deltaproteobacteria bacterium]MDP6074245.1 electron transfer flavoprotein subunit alpha/FixB family protein [Myxococcota bacterium]MDP6244019.1 electron transfer flavoprotein subunit alpha/FixB family protein [Myxococcota bacterium]MDP7075841.1 electron transfer flavoprotein subunit alpha/FixB family protein [Myxococcota bacterium]MDP7298591.1 electron transfer flavoprotein subunit alpha/FixB family protein [Myxococcota bacterium]